MKYLFLLIFILTSHLAIAQESDSKFIVAHSFDDILKEIDPMEKTVVNFWATWCKPCVEEMPYFLELEEKLKDQDIQFIYVSLDFPDSREKKLLPFIQKKMPSQTVIHMMDSDYNNWLHRVHHEWTGAIPATWLLRGDRRYFKEGSFENVEELEGFLKKMD